MRLRHSRRNQNPAERPAVGETLDAAEFDTFAMPPAQTPPGKVRKPETSPAGPLPDVAAYQVREFPDTDRFLNRISPEAPMTMSG